LADLNRKTEGNIHLFIHLACGKNKKEKAALGGFSFETLSYKVFYLPKQCFSRPAKALPRR